MGANYEISEILSEIAEAWNSRTLPCLKKSGCQIQTHLKNAKSQVRTMNPTSAHELRDLVCGSSASRLRCNLGNQEQRANVQVHFQQANNPRLSLSLSLPYCLFAFLFGHATSTNGGTLWTGSFFGQLNQNLTVPCSRFQVHNIVGSKLKNQVSTYYGICWTPR